MNMAEIEMPTTKEDMSWERRIALNMWTVWTPRIGELSMDFQFIKPSSLYEEFRSRRIHAFLDFDMISYSSIITIAESVDNSHFSPSLIHISYLWYHMSIPFKSMINSIAFLSRARSLLIVSTVLSASPSSRSACISTLASVHTTMHHPAAILIP
jgi:hypothetical protein